MELNQNDSPRQPVWETIGSGTLYKNGKPVGPYTLSIRAADTRRCICVAQPAPDGTLPCDH